MPLKGPIGKRFRRLAAEPLRGCEEIAERVGRASKPARPRGLGSPRHRVWDISSQALRFVIVLTWLLLAASDAFGSESFDKRLAKANATLRNGDPEGALTMYRDLQTEDPESEVLYYSMGCAQCKQGELLKDSAPRDAIESFEKAKESFNKVLNARDPKIRKKAQYNHATATGQIAINSIAAQQYEKSKSAFEESIGEYEAFLKQYPKDSSARCNLYHMRYLLKQLLQNPPPPKQQQEGQGEKKQDQSQQEQKQCDNPKQGESEQKSAERKEDEQQGEAQAMAADKDQQEQKDEQKEAKDNPPPENQQDVEAILQSLEDVDKRQQKETKNARTGTEMRKDWW
jgi:Ca-activated chloride channel family protein